MFIVILLFVLAITVVHDLTLESIGNSILKLKVVEITGVSDKVSDSLVNWTFRVTSLNVKEHQWIKRTHYLENLR